MTREKALRQLIQLGALGVLLFAASQGTARASVSPCQQVLTSYRSIDVYSNGPTDQWTEQSCSGLGMFGYQYQCVEFVKRFYYQALGIVRALHWTGNAVDFFASANADVPLKFANNKMLMAFANGGAIPPAPDDILVFSGPNGAGHVAIVSDVELDKVTFVEQNWSLTGEATLALSQSCPPTGCSALALSRSDPPVLSQSDPGSLTQSGGLGC